MLSDEPRSVPDSGVFSLAEEILLLSLLEKKDSVRVPSSISLPFALAGAILIELVQAGGIKLQDGWLIPCTDPAQFDDETLRFSLAKIQKSQKSKKPEQWVFLLGAKGKSLLKDILQSLINKGALLKDGNTYNWPVHQPEIRQRPALTKYLLKEEVRVVLLHQQPIRERILARLVLLDAGDMLDHLFTKDELILARKKVKQLKNGEDLPAESLNLLNRMSEAVKSAVSAAIMG